MIKLMKGNIVKTEEGKLTYNRTGDKISAVGRQNLGYGLGFKRF